MGVIQAEDHINALFAIQKAQINDRRVEPIGQRKKRLMSLSKWLKANRLRIHTAMYADFQKHPTEVDGIEVFHVLSEIKHALNNLDSWSAEKKVDAPFAMLGTRSFIRYEPRGVCLIISPWNYPLGLCLGPLVCALAAGNAIMLKPSELTPNVSALIKDMTVEIFDTGVVSTVEGGAEISELLLKLPFDHIFYTGGPKVGKIVMEAAAKNLTSITLELGGKSPAIVTSSGRITDAARRIACAKFVNNGQTCVAPDYVLIDKKLVEQFVPALIAQTKKLFTENDESFQESKHYCRIVNETHFHRLKDLLTDAIDKGAKVEFGGTLDPLSRFFYPTILTRIPSTARLFEEEIFGPILPIVLYTTLEEAIDYINSRPKPLALYVFSTTEKIQEQVLHQTSSGGVCINDCGIHFLHHNLPFGGVNSSGMGKSHGYFGFQAFSNQKAVLKQRNGITSVSFLYPPYSERVQKLMNWFLKLF